MKRHRCGLWLALAVGWGVGCDSGVRPPLSVGSVAGQVAWGDAGGAQIELVQVTADGALGPAVAQAVVGADGQYQFPGLRLDNGDYALRVGLGDRALTAPVLDYVRYSDRAITVSPLTTLAMTSAQARDGGPERFAGALADLRRHIGLDPVTTAVGAVSSDLSDAPTRYVLLLDALEAVAVRRAPPGSVSLPALFDALIADAGADGLDGLGPDGPIALGSGRLGDQALQSEWADAVLALVTEGAWQPAGEAAARGLIARLRCSGSPLFPACTPVDPDADSTPPVIEAIDPSEGTPLSGLTVFTVQASDPDGELERLEFVRLEGSEVAETYPALDGRPNVFQVDTRLLRGQDTLRVRVTAHNAAGLSSQRDFTYPLENIGRGVLAGWVTKGPARNALIKAYGFDGLAQVPLGEARTDAEGRFEIEVAEYSGPVLVEAASDPAAEPRTIFEDEVGGETGWPADRTLTTLHPSFDALAENPPVSVTPFGDLAGTLARRQAAENQGSLVEAHRNAAEAVGAWLGLDAPVVSLIHGRPAPFGQAAAGFEDPERIAMALGCFSEQAATLSARAFPAGEDKVNALDLVALYRLDAETDGRVDGLAGAAPATILVGATAVALPSDALRADLPGACARWAGNARNQMAVEPQALVAWRRGLASQEDARLFDPTLPPRPADEEPPTVVGTWAAADDGVISGPELDAAADTPLPQLPAVRGTVRVQLVVSDASGPAVMDVALRGQPEVAFAGVEQTATVGERFEVQWAGTLDTDALPEGEHALLVDVEDPLDNRTQRDLRFRVDRTPPTLGLLSELAASSDGNEWHSRGEAPATVVVDVQEQGAGTLEVRLAGEVLVDRAFEGPTRVDVQLPAQAREGRFRIDVRVSEALDEPVVAEQTFVVDRTPPSLNVLTTRYADEAQLGLDRALDESDELELDNTGGTLRRWQTSWGEDADNPAVLALVVQDQAGDFPGTVAPEVAVQLDYCIGDPVACEVARGSSLVQGGGQRSERFTAGVDGLLALDPSDPPPPIDMTVSLTATDLSGNRQTTRLSYTIEVIPPPLDVRIAAPLVRFDDDSLHRLLIGQEVAFGQVTLSNPHATPVTVSFEATQRLEADLSIQRQFGILEELPDDTRLLDCQRWGLSLTGGVVLREDCASLAGRLDCTRAQECIPFSLQADQLALPLIVTPTGFGPDDTVEVEPMGEAVIDISARSTAPLDPEDFPMDQGYAQPPVTVVFETQTSPPRSLPQTFLIRQVSARDRIQSVSVGNFGLGNLRRLLSGSVYFQNGHSAPLTIRR